jgi:hypothetical protein
MLTVVEVLRVPPRPKQGVFEVRKSGSKWEILRNGHYATGNLPTKTVAVQTRDRLEALERSRVAQWHEQWDVYLTTAKEGVGFVYADA